MGKNMLIAGKDFPNAESFAKSVVSGGYNVAVAGSLESESQTKMIDHAVALKWNKASPISARSMLLETENSFGGCDVVLLYFDAPSFAERFMSCSVEDVSRGADAIVVGFQYLAVETFARFAQKKVDGRLVFLLKNQTTVAEGMRSPQRGGVPYPAGPIVAGAQAAFSAFAENFAALAHEREYGSVSLVVSNAQSGIATKDNELATWLLEYLQTSASREKSAKQTPSWVKAGAKTSGFFSSIFR